MVKFPVNLENVISGRIYDNGWRDMTEEEQRTNLEEIKAALLETCRGVSETSRAISRMSLSNLPKNIGIYRRVSKEGYTAGQSYPEELQYVKNTIKRQC